MSGRLKPYARGGQSPDTLPRHDITHASVPPPDLSWSKFALFGRHPPSLIQEEQVSLMARIGRL